MLHYPKAAFSWEETMLKGRSLIEPDNFSLEETDALFALAEKIETDDRYLR